MTKSCLINVEYTMHIDFNTEVKGLDGIKGSKKKLKDWLWLNS